MGHERLAMPGASARPRRQVAVLACMDARLEPLALLGLEVGDAARDVELQIIPADDYGGTRRA